MVQQHKMFVQLLITMSHTLNGMQSKKTSLTYVSVGAVLLPVCNGSFTSYVTEEMYNLSLLALIPEKIQILYSNRSSKRKCCYGHSNVVYIWFQRDLFHLLRIGMEFLNIM